MRREGSQFALWRSGTCRGGSAPIRARFGLLAVASAKCRAAAGRNSGRIAHRQAEGAVEKAQPDTAVEPIDLDGITIGSNFVVS